ncbi:MAG: crossover junction endodeoxyribonuclease RuvC [Bacteroidia bacterium]|nr:crossover junction endodeoxyribonuclease RuvC [Bacteroidia bacterium]MDW8088560.1 crossover junction endodeoxyribonuclease RuvC [Bacteroidia bacterium]
MSLWLGIDPGAQAVGLALVEGSHAPFRLLKAETLSLTQSRALDERLHTLYAGLEAFLASFSSAVQPAMEAPFLGHNPRSALILGAFQGAIWGFLCLRGYPPPIRLAPARIKKAITGRAHADKTQVAAMLSYYLKGTLPPPSSNHATDAIAIALAAAFLQNSPITRRFTSRAER